MLAEIIIGLLAFCVPASLLIIGLKMAEFGLTRQACEGMHCHECAFAGRCRL